MENHIDFVEAELHIQHTPTKTKYSLPRIAGTLLKIIYLPPLLYKEQ